MKSGCKVNLQVGETTCTLSASTKASLKYGLLYYLEVRKSDNSSFSALFSPTNQDTTTVSGTPCESYVNGAPIQYSGVPELNAKLDLASIIPTEAGTLTETEAATYVTRYVLMQASSNVAGSIVFVDFNNDLKDNRGIYVNNYNDPFKMPFKPAGWAHRNLSLLIKNARNIPSFVVRIPSGLESLVRVDPVADELIIALWKAAPAAYADSSPEEVTIFSDDYSGVVTVHSNFHQEWNAASFVHSGVQRGNGEVVIPNLSVSERPIIIRVAR